LFHNDLIQTPIVSVNRQNILYSIAAQNYLQFFAALEKALSKLENYIGASAMDHWWLYKENRDWGTSIQPMKNPTANGKNILKYHMESWQRTPINVISPSMFHLNLVESVHLQSSKTS
jgi:hypothetical protein